MPGPIRGRQQLQAFIQKSAEDASTLEVVNVSASPEEVYAADSVEVNANDWESFTDQLPTLQDGDMLRVRTRDASGNVSNWMMLQATDDTPDTRNAQVYVDALGMEANKNGGIDFVYIGDGMVSEPGATMRLTNERTGEHTDVVIGENGQLPADLSLTGRAGDKYQIAVSDGTNNVDFSEVAGVLNVDGVPRPQIADPTVVAKKHLDSDGNPTISTNYFEGPLFIDEPTLEDVKQGSIANCYFAATVASIAKTHPERIKEMIKPNDDGTYTVTFQQRDFYGRVKPRKVTIDGDLYVNYEGSNKPVYGKSNGNERGTDTIEMWFPLLEKAYATLKGNSYDNIGNGGHPGEVISDLLGTSTSYDRLTTHSAERVWRKIQSAEAKGHPMAAGTYGKDSDEAERYAGEKVYAWHVYSVLGVEEKNGEKFVNLRNPWGNTEPGYDGKNDGIFSLPLEKFAHLYKGVTIGE